jgi:hypothetical protein
MASHPRLSLLSSALACSVLVACAGLSPASPTLSPAYRCVPEAGADPVPCGPIEFEQAQARDALYAEAEAVYRRFWTEWERLYAFESPAVSLEIEATTAGSFLKYVEAEFAAPSYARRVAGNARLVRLARYVGGSHSGFTVSLNACWDSSGVTFSPRGGGPETTGGAVDENVFLSRLDGVLKLVEAESETVRQC